PLGDIARVVDVLACAAGALAVRRRAMVVELQRDADDVVTLLLQQQGRGRGIDAAGHGDDDPGILRTAFEIERVAHGVGQSERSAGGASRLDMVGKPYCGPGLRSASFWRRSGFAHPEKAKEVHS